MRIAAIYDIHGNFPALEAVLYEIGRLDVDRLIVGGDVIAGPMPIQAIELLQNIKHPIDFILGNAEAEFLHCIDNEPINGLSEIANEEARWSSTNLPTQVQKFIRSWSSSVTLRHPSLGNILFCHATPRSNVEVFTSQTSEEMLLPIFQKTNENIVICGHTHIPFERNIGDTRVINSGSVGMPFGSSGADWLLIDQGIEFMHTDFNLAEAAKIVKKSNYPRAEYFAENHILKSPSREQAMAMLASIEKNQMDETMNL